MPMTKGPWRLKYHGNMPGGVTMYWVNEKTSVATSNKSDGQAIAALPELMEVLRSIEQYGSDTLSGNAQGPNDADWYRDGVREMRNRARTILALKEAEL